MMTFEEFFLKKKIDLEQLAQYKPEIFAEFKSHFEQMSEKSFDHTKKYWFNDLRRKFPLSEEKETALKEAFKPTEIPSAPITEEIKKVSEAPKSTGFKPRFKPALIQKEKVILEEKVETVMKPSGFKPKFKSKISVEESNMHDAPSKEKIEIETEKKAATKKGEGI
nr:hypothetical protein [Pseudopedobacter sp.]